MMCRVTNDLLTRLETYYDAVPRRFSRTEECGPFTLFLGEPGGWVYYARPRLGEPTPVTPEDVVTAADRLRDSGLPQTIEWVHETTPTLLDAVRSAGSFELEKLPLLVLDGELTVTGPPLPDGVTVRLLGPGDADAVSAATAVSSVGFAAEGTERGDAGAAERDAAEKPAQQRVLDLLADGGVRIAVAEQAGHGIVSTGRTLPAGDVTEVMGVATLPSARRQGLGAAVTAALVDDARDLGLRTVFLTASSEAVARVYASIGFQRIATGWAAERH
jgi:GNAT superfamily N-acetyltransferase